MGRLAVVFVVVGLIAGCGGDDEQEGLAQGSDPVEIDPSRFSAEIDHPFWPMTPGTVWVYREGEQRVEVTVTDRTRRVLGVETRVVHDLVTENGVPVEDTFDWYAQDDDGNLWYFGEDTTEFEDGEPVGHAGAWEAGVDGALPGIVLPAEPEVGMSYRQEYYAGEAEDRAKVLSLDESASVPFGEFTGALETEDTTPLEPDVVEHKFYVRDVGPVLALQINGESQREELVSRTPG
jgi:hypothetical protein